MVTICMFWVTSTVLSHFQLTIVDCVELHAANEEESYGSLVHSFSVREHTVFYL